MSGKTIKRAIHRVTKINGTEIRYKNLATLKNGGVFEFHLDSDRVAVADALDSYPALVAALKRFCKLAGCNCAEGGEGFQCDVCEGRQALKDAGEME